MLTPASLAMRTTIGSVIGVLPAMRAIVVFATRIVIASSALEPAR